MLKPAGSSTQTGRHRRRVEPALSINRKRSARAARTCRRSPTCATRRGGGKWRSVVRERVGVSGRWRRERARASSICLAASHISFCHPRGEKPEALQKLNCRLKLHKCARMPPSVSRARLQSFLKCVSPPSGWPLGARAAVCTPHAPTRFHGLAAATSVHRAHDCAR